MKINNIFSILFVALSLLAFSCNHTPAAKKEDKTKVTKDEKDNKKEKEDKGKENLEEANKVVSTLKSELEKINSALKAAKEIEIGADLLDDGKVKEGKEADVKALYKDPIFKDIVIAKDATKEDIHGKLDVLAKAAKQAKLDGAVDSLKKIDGYKEEPKYAKFLNEHKDVKDLIAGLTIK